MTLSSLISTLRHIKPLRQHIILLLHVVLQLQVDFEVDGSQGQSLQEVEGGGRAGGVVGFRFVILEFELIKLDKINAHESVVIIAILVDARLKLTGAEGRRSNILVHPLLPKGGVGPREATDRRPGQAVRSPKRGHVGLGVDEAAQGSEAAHEEVREQTEAESVQE